MRKIPVTDDEVLFNINEVAKMIEVVPATIRNWEKHGLFIAKRKENNYRVYNFADIELLKKIKYYSLVENMSISAIKNIIRTNIPAGNMHIPSGGTHGDIIYSKKLISSKWKESREKLNYTLEDVSNATGISPSYLSKIENGQANISLDVLNKLAEFYGESILYFFDKESTENKVVRKDSGEKIDVGLKGVTMESLISVKNHILYPIIFTVEPGCGSLETHRHHGEEFLYILTGKIEVVLNDSEVYILKPGDSMYFKSFDYHRWCNAGKKIAKILWVHSPVEA